MHVEPGATCQPSLDLSLLVRGVIVDNQMDSQVLGRLSLQLLEEAQAVGIQIVSCDSAHIGPDTGRVRFSHTFVGQLARGAEPRPLSRCLGST